MSGAWVKILGVTALGLMVLGSGGCDRVERQPASPPKPKAVRWSNADTAQPKHLPTQPLAPAPVSLRSSTTRPWIKA